MILVTGLLLLVSGIVSAQLYSHQAELDTSGKVKLSWDIKQDEISMEISVETMGYVAVGFSPSGGMKGADIVMAYVNDHSGNTFFKDMYAEGYDRPKEDPSQDYELLYITQNDTHTTVGFKRYMVTCDASRDIPLTGDTLKVIWAYSDMDRVTYHGPFTRGTRSLYLTSFSQSPLKDKDIDKYKTWDVVNANFTIPHDDGTTYWCKILKVPDLQTKHQVVGFAPIITPGNEGYVHHILLYECVHPSFRNEQFFRNFVKHDGAHCYTPNMPDEWNYCEAVTLGWAIGGQGRMFPDLAGAPLGSKFSGVDYYMLEIHYDNPLKNAGIVDNSGLRLFYTDQLRQYDSALLMVGHPVTPVQMIPPEQSSYTTIGSCDSKCTQQLLPPEGIKAFQVLLHAHKAGRAIRVRHFRNGTELEPIAQDNHYDFDYQQTRALQPEVHILPGDTLFTECMYSTTERNTLTFGGLSTTDEMCLVLLSYYPRVNGSLCFSMPSVFDIASAFGVEYDNRQEMEPILNNHSAINEFVTAKLGGALRPYNLSLLDYLYGGVAWSDEVAARLQTVTTSSDHVMVCRRQANINAFPETVFVPLPTEEIGQFSSNYSYIERPDRCLQEDAIHLVKR